MAEEATTEPLRIHGWCCSPFSYKVLLVLARKRVAYEWVPAPLMSRRQLERKTGLTQVPVLEVGELWMGDSTRIIQWLERRFPTPSVYPSDPVRRAAALLLEDWADESFVIPAHLAVWCPPGNARELLARCVADDPRFGTRFGKIVFQRLAARMFRKMATERRTLEGAQQHLSFQLDMLDARLHPSAYLFGDEPTVADYAVASQVINLLGLKNEELLRARPALYDFVIRVARELPERCAVPIPRAAASGDRFEVDARGAA